MLRRYTQDLTSAIGQRVGLLGKKVTAEDCGFKSHVRYLVKHRFRSSSSVLWHLAIGQNLLRTDSGPVAQLVAHGAYRFIYACYADDARGCI